MTSRPPSIYIPLVHPECGKAGSDNVSTGIPYCILARKLATVSAQTVADTVYDSKVNPYEAFENPPLPMDRLVFLSYVIFFLILICISIVFMSTISGIRKNTILIFAFVLILLLSLLEERWRLVVKKMSLSNDSPR